MKRLLQLLSLAVLLVMPAKAVTVIVYPRDITSGTPNYRNVTATLIGPSGTAVAGPWSITGDSVTLNTGTAGYVAFSNMLAIGEYRMDIAGNPPRSFPFSISQTNGTFNLISLLGTNNSVPVFYDSTQINALLASGIGTATNAQFATTATNAINATNFWGLLNLTNMPSGVLSSNQVSSVGDADWFFWVDASTNYYCLKGDLTVQTTGRDFGALLQAAANASGDNTRFVIGPVAKIPGSYVPYIVSNTVVFTHISTLAGAGDPTTIIQPAPLLASNLFSFGTVGAPVMGLCKAENIKFDGSAGSATACGGLWFNSTQAVARNCQLNLFPFYGIRISSPAVSTWNVFAGDWISCPVNGVGLLFDQSPPTSEAYVDNCLFYSTGGRSLVVSNTFNNLNIRDNRFWLNGPQTTAIDIFAGANFLVEGNVFAGYADPTFPITLETRTLVLPTANFTAFGNISAGGKNFVNVGANVVSVTVDANTGSDGKANRNTTGWTLMQGTESNLTILNGLVLADTNGGRSAAGIGANLSVTGGTLAVVNLTNAAVNAAFNATNVLGSGAYGSAQNYTNQSWLIGLNATNNDAIVGSGITNGAINNLSNYALTISQNATNQAFAIGANVTNGAINNLSNFALTISQNSTNQSWLIGLNATNDDILLGINLTNGAINQLTNYALTISQNATNQTFLMGANVTNGAINNLSNYVFTLSQNGTNQSFLIGANVTNGAINNLTNYANTLSQNGTNQSWLIGLNATNDDYLLGANITNGGLNQLTNYANTLSQNATNQSKLIGLNATNDDYLLGANVTNGAINNLSNYVNAVAGNTPTLGGNNAFVGAVNTFAHLSSMDSLVVTNGFTNLSLTANSLVYSGPFDRLLSVLPGGPNQFLQAGNPPAFATILGSQISGPVTLAAVATMAQGLTSAATGTNNIFYTDQYLTNALSVQGKLITVSNALGSVIYNGGNQTNSGGITIGASQALGAADGHLLLNANSVIASGIGVISGPQTFNSSSGTGVGLEVLDNVNMSGTAGFVGMAVVANVSSTGSGNNDLYEGWNVASLKFNVDISGNQTNVGVIKAPTIYGHLVGNADTATTVNSATYATIATNLLALTITTNQSIQIIGNSTVSILYPNGGTGFSINTNGAITMLDAVGDSIMAYSGAPYSGETFSLGMHHGTILSANGTATTLYDQAGAAQLQVSSANIQGAVPFISKLLIAPKTANYAVQPAESGTYYNNNGAVGAVTNTLPAAAVGLHFSAAVVANFNVAFRANGSDTFRNGAVVSGAGGLVYSSTVGDTIHFYCPASGGWWIDNTGSTNHWTLQ